MRFAIFIHDPYGDMGLGRILGGFRSGKAADEKAEAIRRQSARQGHELECIVVEQLDAGAAAREVVEAIGEES